MKMETDPGYKWPVGWRGPLIGPGPKAFARYAGWVREIIWFSKTCWIRAVDGGTTLIGCQLEADPYKWPTDGWRGPMIDPGLSLCRITWPGGSPSRIGETII
jgi:hypothetical protein